MYKVICQYEDALMGFISYVVEDCLTKEEAEDLAKTNEEYFVKEY